MTMLNGKGGPRLEDQFAAAPAEAAPATAAAEPTVPLPTEPPATAEEATPVITNLAEHSQEVADEMERRDETAIREELLGGKPGQMVYAFRSTRKVTDKDGKPVKDNRGKDKYEEYGRIIADLSAGGWAAVRYRYEGIEIDRDGMKIDREIMPGFITVFLYGRDTYTGCSAWAAGTHKLMGFSKGSGKAEPNPFAVQIALTKAIRNVTKTLIPISLPIPFAILHEHLVKVVPYERPEWALWMYPDWVQQDVAAEMGIRDGGKPAPKPAATAAPAAEAKPTEQQQPTAPAATPAPGGQRQRDADTPGGFSEAQMKKLMVEMAEFGKRQNCSAAVVANQVKAYLKAAFGHESKRKLTSRQMSEVIGLLQQDQLDHQLERLNNRSAEQRRKSA